MDHSKYFVISVINDKIMTLSLYRCKSTLFLESKMALYYTLPLLLRYVVPSFLAAWRQFQTIVPLTQ